MEYNALEVATAGMADKVLHGLGRLLREETNVDVAHSGVDCSGGGEVRRSGRCSRSSGRDGLLFSGGALVEDISLARFCVPRERRVRPEYKGIRHVTYSGSERVNIKNRLRLNPVHARVGSR